MSSSSHFRCRMDPRTCWTRREEGLSGFAVTCGKSREEAEAIRIPLAGGRIDRAKPASGPGFVAHQPKGRCGAQDRSGSVADMRFFDLQGPCRNLENHTRGQSRSWPEQSGRGQTPAGARRRLSDADIIRRYSGRACAAPPLLLNFPEAKPACGPPDDQMAKPRRSVSRGIALACCDSNLLWTLTRHP
jgi:hypothetical protein